MAHLTSIKLMSSMNGNRDTTLEEMRNNSRMPQGVITAIYPVNRRLLKTRTNNSTSKGIQTIGKVVKESDVAIHALDLIFSIAPTASTRRHLNNRLSGIGKQSAASFVFGSFTGLRIPDFVKNQADFENYINPMGVSNLKHYAGDQKVNGSRKISAIVAGTMSIYNNGKNTIFPGSLVRIKLPSITKEKRAKARQQMSSRFGTADNRHLPTLKAMKYKHIYKTIGIYVNALADSLDKNGTKKNHNLYKSLSLNPERFKSSSIENGIAHISSRFPEYLAFTSALIDGGYLEWTGTVPVNDNNRLNSAFMESINGGIKRPVHANKNNAFRLSVMAQALGVINNNNLKTRGISSSPKLQSEIIKSTHFSLLDKPAEQKKYNIANFLAGHNRIAMQKYYDANKIKPIRDSMQRQFELVCINAKKTENNAVLERFARENKFILGVAMKTSKATSGTRSNKLILYR